MENYTEEDEKYFDQMQLVGGKGLSWDDRQELYKYLEWKKHKDNKSCDYCNGSGYDPYDSWGAIHETCPRCNK